MFDFAYPLYLYLLFLVPLVGFALLRLEVSRKAKLLSLR